MCLFTFTTSSLNTFFFSMGLNDVNLTTKEQFVENYMQLLYQCKQASPNSEFIIMAVTPVRSKFCKNEKIDEYNSALRYAIDNCYYSHYHFVDPTALLKGSDNKLMEKYAFEDGTHLEMSGMRVCLWYMYNQNIRYSFKGRRASALKMPRHFTIRISLLIISALKTKKRRKFAEILQISAVLFILPIYFFIFVCYYIKVIFKACKTLRKEIKMKKLNLKAIAVAMAAALTLGLAGCSSNGNSSTADSSATAGDSTSVTESKAEGDNSLQKVKDAGQFILGLDATFKPMGYTDENGEIVGFDIDVAEEVCKRLGVKLVKQPVNWDTLTTDLNVGKCDCIWNGLSINKERQEKMNLSEPYMKNAMVFVVKGDSTVAKMDDLKGKKISVQNGSSAQTILENSAIKDDITISPIATNVEALQQLELGVVDVVFLDEVVADYEIKNSGKDYKKLAEGLEEEQYAIAFRKNDQALRDAVQKTLGEMKADGKLGEISTKWFGSDITIVK